MTSTDTIYQSLFRIARALFSAEDDDRTPDVLLRHVIELTGAERGFVVVRDGEGFERRAEVRFDDATLTAMELTFSKTLVRRAIESGQVLYSPNFAADPRFQDAKSVQASALSAVLVAPLVAHREVFGVLYLVGGFGGDLTGPIGELAELAGVCIQAALERKELRRKNAALEHDLFGRHDFDGIITEHPAMLALLETVAQVADSRATVLIHGETGTGKELIARALHVNSPRKDKPYGTVHCTALPSSTLESELFGHEKGAFTGADKRREGRIATLHGGTLFLDEIGEIPLEAQAKLLRLMQFGELQRLGSDKPEKVDVRIVAATHRSLGDMVKEGRFRQDLYFRLKVIELDIPPLRERRSDVLPLLAHFLALHGRKGGRSMRFAPDAERALTAYDYPGNVRELAHLVERACLLARGDTIPFELLPSEVRGKAPAAAPRFAALTNDALHDAREAAIREVEQTFLGALMAEATGNVSRAAQLAGMQRTYLQKLIARYR